MYILKQSTAVTLKMGPFLDSTDGITAETALTIAQADVRVTKNGANIAQKNEATSATHDELGYYDVPLDTTDTNTLGWMKIAVHATGALPVWEYAWVVDQNYFDAVYSTATVLTGSDLGLLLDTTASSVTSQTVYVLPASGPTPSDQNDEYNGLTVTLVDASNTERKSTRYVTDYVGSTRTLTVSAAPSFTIAANDEIQIHNIAHPDGSTLATNVTTVDTNVDAVKTVTDNIGATAATNMGTIYAEAETGTVQDTNVTPTTTVFATASLTDTVADAYVGKELMFTSGNLDKERRTISDSSWSAGNSETTLTVDAAFSAAPANTDAFVII